MSKQYLTTHTIDLAHPTDVFSLAVTPSQIFSASGSSTLRVHSTTQSDFPLVQELRGVHQLGCHHVITAGHAPKAASVGFGGEVKIWKAGTDGIWEEEGSIKDGNKAGELWAIALSDDGQYLAATSHDGRINVWDLAAKRMKIRNFQTEGSFGMCIDLSIDGRFTASGHQNGSVYIFNNETKRLLHHLPGLVRPIRAVAFSPASKLLAAAGDARIIALYDVASGEQVANLLGHTAWIFSLDFNDTGYYLLSGAYDGRVKVWSIETRTCVATISETDKTIWSVKWLPKTASTRNEGFAAAGANKSISFYREASGS